MGAAVPGPRRPWQGRRVLLGVTGGIAAYKSVQLARDLTRLGAEVDTVLTPAAVEFVRPLSFEAVTGRAAHTNLYQPGGAVQHIRLGQRADVVVVAPATADILARIAHGLADDLLTTTLLATRAPLVLCPAMNDRMWDHPQVQENVARLARHEGSWIAGPGVGPLAYGEGEGPGRMLEVHEIIEHVGRALSAGSILAGRQVLVSAGPTREPLDPVRYLGNRSSGRMGYAVAQAAWRRGARVTLVSGPTALAPPVGVDVVGVETALEMRDAIAGATTETDVVIMAAAVADYRPSERSPEKIKKKGKGSHWTMDLEENPNIIRETRLIRKEGAVVVGFAIETADLVENARQKLETGNLHLVVANDPGEEGAGFEVDTNRVTLVRRGGGAEELPLLSKSEVAERLLDRIEDMLREKT